MAILSHSRPVEIALTTFARDKPPKILPKNKSNKIQKMSKIMQKHNQTKHENLPKQMRKIMPNNKSKKCKNLSKIPPTKHQKKTKICRKICPKFCHTKNTKIQTNTPKPVQKLPKTRPIPVPKSLPQKHQTKYPWKQVRTMYHTFALFFVVTTICFTVV